jgi:hypothetical protein
MSSGYSVKTPERLCFWIQASATWSSLKTPDGRVDPLAQKTQTTEGVMRFSVMPN